MNWSTFIKRLLIRLVPKCRKTEELVKEQGEFLGNILDSLTHPFYVIDVNDYTVKMANHAAGFGDLSEGKTCYALTHNSDTPCKSNEHPCTIEKIRVTKNR